MGVLAVDANEGPGVEWIEELGGPLELDIGEGAPLVAVFLEEPCEDEDLQSVKR